MQTADTPLPMHLRLWRWLSGYDSGSGKKLPILRELQHGCAQTNSRECLGQKRQKLQNKSESNIQAQTQADSLKNANEIGTSSRCRRTKPYTLLQDTDHDTIIEYFDYDSFSPVRLNQDGKQTSEGSHEDENEDNGESTGNSNRKRTRSIEGRDYVPSKVSAEAISETHGLHKIGRNHERESDSSAEKSQRGDKTKRKALRARSVSTADRVLAQSSALRRRGAEKARLALASQPVEA